MKLKQTIKIFVVIFCIVSIIPIGFYVYKFWGTSLSDNPNDWNSFGGFFSILNPIIAVANLIVIGFLTYLIYKAQNELGEKTIQSQKEIAKINIKQQAYISITNTVDNFNQSMRSNERMEDKLLDARRLRAFLVMSNNNNAHLFDIETIRRCNETVASLDLLLDQMEQFTRDIYNQITFESITQDYSAKYLSFIASMRNSIL